MSEHDDDLIRVWPFHKAPQNLKDLSTNGGDEDWLALVPGHIAKTDPRWLDRPYFGICEVDEYPQPDGYVVYIGTHA